MSILKQLPHEARTADTTIRPSWAIWGDCPLLDVRNDMSVGTLMEDDFAYYSSTATTVLNASGLPTFEGACTITGTTTPGGEVALLCSASNEEGALEAGGGVSAPFTISDTAGSEKKLWFETRIKKSLITDLDNMFVGLAAPGSGVADFINDAGTDFADVSLLGFVQFEADGDSFDLVYQNTGQAFATPISGVAVPVADTYIKLGFKYDPSNPTARRITVYVNGVASSTYITGANIAASLFPDGDALTPLVAVKGSDAADKTVTMEWWRCVQLR